MIKWKNLIISILIPVIIGFLGSIVGNVMNGFDGINKPAFTPPAIVFPIAWSILYILMGISSYLIFESDSSEKDSALLIYGIQLVINSLWTFFFFNLKWFLFSFVLVLIILLFVIVMIIKFYKINKTAAYLQIPYVVWLIFAAILSYNVFLLN